MRNDVLAQSNRAAQSSDLIAELQAADKNKLFSDVEQRKYETLCELLQDASQAYYNGEETGISDLTFDHYIKFLRDIEERGLVTIKANTPTKVNGGTPHDNIEHAIPMLSLRDVFTEEELVEWARNSFTGLKDFQPIFSVEPKIDGLSVEIWYFRGRLIKAVTRGNGLVGEDVTDKVLAIRTIPNAIPYTDKLVVRGEVYMSKESFKQYQDTQDPTAKNARNTAVGLFKRKDGGKAAGLYLDCWVFNVQLKDPMDESHLESLGWLARQGFHVISHAACDSFGEVLLAVDGIREERKDMPFQIDGAVIKIDSILTREYLGDNGSVPKWAVAFKYPAPQAKTRLLRIDYQLGKTGKLTPVAILDPIDVDGSTVARCTLHNKRRLDDLGIQIGDMVYLHKAGDIIPQITAIEHTPESKPLEYPTECPVCEGKLDGEVCVNAYCPSKLEFKLQFWVSKEGLNMKGISTSLVSLLQEKGLIKTPADYYKLLPKDLYLLPKMGATKIKNTLETIAASTQKTFDAVLTAMCIDGVGGKAAYTIAQAAPNWDALTALTEADCAKLIGPSAGKKLFDALQTDYYKSLIEELRTIFKY